MLGASSSEEDDDDRFVNDNDDTSEVPLFGTSSIWRELPDRLHVQEQITCLGICTFVR